MNPLNLLVYIEMIFMMAPALLQIYSADWRNESLETESVPLATPPALALRLTQFKLSAKLWY